MVIRTVRFQAKHARFGGAGMPGHSEHCCRRLISHGCGKAPLLLVAVKKLQHNGPHVTMVKPVNYWRMVGGIVAWSSQKKRTGSRLRMTSYRSRHLRSASHPSSETTLVISLNIALMASDCDAGHRSCRRSRSEKLRLVPGRAPAPAGGPEPIALSGRDICPRDGGDVFIAAARTVRIDSAPSAPGTNRGDRHVERRDVPFNR